ncbi:hypothetical protein Lser_V15G38900 [Lactuca serriola]
MMLSILTSPLINTSSSLLLTHPKSGVLVTNQTVAGWGRSIRGGRRGALVIATPYASGFDHFFIADEVQFKFDRCLRALHQTVRDLPSFGIGHSLGSVIHLVIGSRHAIQMCGNVYMAFNNKDANMAEMNLKNLENLNPRIMKQIIPLIEQLPPLYMELANGRDNFSPQPEETQRLIKSYYGISRNLLIKFKDDTIDPP